MTRAIEFVLFDEARRLGESPERILLENASNEITMLRNRLAASLRRNRVLDALVSAGVDEWEGYNDALENIRKEEGDSAND